MEVRMKKISVVLLFITMMSMMACENAKKKDVGATEEAPVAVVEKTKVVVVARAAIKEGQEAAFMDVANVLVEATRQEPGCLFYALYRSPSDPGSFIFYEEYKDKAAFAAHGSSNHFKTFADAIGEMLAKELIIDQF
jgi:quinol monooxygenase YgiN